MIIDNFNGDICPLAPTRQGQHTLHFIERHGVIATCGSILGTEITFHGPIGSSALAY